MPKCNLSNRQSRYTKLSENIRVIIVTNEERRHVSRAQTIKASGMSQSAFYLAWKQPELFRVGNLHDVYEFLRVPEEERRYV